MAKVEFHETMANSYSILMTDSVFDEITRKKLPGSDEYRKLLKESRLTIFPVTIASTAATDIKLQKLDRGERETILLFNKGYGDFMVTDDGAAARFCRNNKIPFVNSLLLLRLLFLSERIDLSSFNTGFQSLLELGRYSEKVKEYAQRCPYSELDFFLPSP
jgi:hypothetical protein